MKKAFIIGYYGYSNLGDDYILYAMLDMLNKSKCTHIYIEVNKITKEYEELRNLYKNLDIVYIIKDKSLGILTKLKLISKVDYLIIGGGGLFTEESSKPIFMMNVHVSIAKLFNTKAALFGVDVNVASLTKLQKKIWNVMLNKLQFISVRSMETKEMLLSCNNNVKIDASTDMTFALQTKSEKINSSNNILKNNNDKYILWSLAMPFSKDEMKIEQFKNRYELLCEQIVSIANSYSNKYVNVFIPFFYENDINFINDIISKINGKYKILNTPNNFIAFDKQRLIFKYSELNICMRFHSVAFSIYNNSKFVAISYSPKTTRLLNELNINNYVEYGIRNSQFFFKEFDLDKDKLMEKINSELNKKTIYNYTYCINKAKNSREEFIEWINF